MYIRTLRCYVCHKQYPRTRMQYRCDCGGGLEILYDYAKLRKVVSWKILLERPLNHWRYAEFYPTLKQCVSLGEGGTPLIRSFKHSKLHFKLEGCNPTGSFKDRGSTIEISHALEFGHPSIVCATTGNMGASVAAYSARCGLHCEIVLPDDAAGTKIEQIRTYGATISPVRGNYTDAMNLAFVKHTENKQFLVGDYCFRGEGEKSVGFEIVDQFLLEHQRAPDYIIVPVGNGTLVSGIWKGLKEFKGAGLISRLPKIVGVQATGCNPIEIAYRTNRAIRPQIPKTMAGAVACGDPLDGVAALRAVHESGGTLLSFTDREILSARHDIAQSEGIDVEPSGALPYAAWKKLQLNSKHCVLVLTGNALKDLENL